MIEEVREAAANFKEVGKVLIFPWYGIGLMNSTNHQQNFKLTTCQQIENGELEKEDYLNVVP